MNTPSHWQQSFDTKGLITTINDFCDYAIVETSVDPAYSFAHIALDDYNLSNGDIEWCLHNDRVNEYLMNRYSELPEHAIDHTSDNYWDNYAYWGLIDGVQLTIDFMNWLMTIPEDERDRQCEMYYEGN